MISIKNCTIQDYPILKKLYEDSGWFDRETDSEEKITSQIQKEPNSILLAVENDEIIGTVTLLFTGRLGLFFRLVSESKEARAELLRRGEEIFKQHQYNEVHVIAPLNDNERQSEYEEFGFTKGKDYKWFWKKI